MTILEMLRVRIGSGLDCGGNPGYADLGSDTNERQAITALVRPDRCETAEPSKVDAEYIRRLVRESIASRTPLGASA